MKIVQKQYSGKICESKGIARIYEVHYNPQHQGAVKVSNEFFEIYLPQLKTTKRKKYNLKESYNDFLIYYNNNKHSTTKVAPFRAIMNVENRDLIYKI